MNTFRFFTFFLPIIFSLAGLSSPDSTYNVKDYGAAADGVAKDTAAIRSALNDASKQGGGRVLFPAGTYLTGTIDLKDNITLVIQEGATLRGSKDLSDYPIRKPKIRSYTDNYVQHALIYAENAKNVSIQGRGTIDGQGESFFNKDYLVRPYVIRMASCKNVSIEGVTLINSPMWMQHYLACDGVTIRGIRVNNLCNYNNDGIDIDSCRNVILSDCEIYSDDDAICLKSTTPRPCENVTITNCVIGSFCNALKMGTETNGGFKNIAISNCVISPPQKPLWRKRTVGISGIALEIVDGGVMDGVVISNISMSGVKSPLFIRLGNRARPHTKDSAPIGVGEMKNIIISNVIARDIGPYGCVISGIPNHLIQDISLNNLMLEFPGGIEKTPQLSEVPEKENSYPEATMFGATPSYGLFMRHVDGISMNGLRLILNQSDLRPAMVFDDVSDVQLINSQLQASENSSIVHLKDSSDIIIQGCSTMASSKAFLSGEGAVSEIILMNNLFNHSETVVLNKEIEKHVFLSGNRMPN